jgi:hypothetical protein
MPQTRTQTTVNLSTATADTLREIAGATREVELTRTMASSTADKAQQALWTAIRTSTNATNFNLFNAYLDRVFCDNTGATKEPAQTLYGDLVTRANASYTFMGVDAYQLLKKATEAFLLVHCGVVIRNEKGTSFIDGTGTAPDATGGDESVVIEADPVTDVDGLDESSRVGSAWTYHDAKSSLASYLNTGGTLPYLDKIVAALFPDADPEKPQDTEGAPFCADILRYRWTCPSLIELIWSFWHEESSLVQTMNAIGLRFQNRRSPSYRDPLAHLKLAPLRPLNNLLWGYIQDEINRLTLVRRSYEYAQQYGLSLVGKAVPEMQTVENRSKFLEAFNNLLTISARFFKEDDDRTIKPDAFPVLNALKDVHLILAQGAVNQFGDLPWTSRVEMLIQKWLMSRDEIREYLGRNPMVAYSEPWMSQVETMKSLQGWSDVSVSHFRDLGVFGEQLLLSIRYADWGNINDMNQAANWARYWRSELQAYMYSYRAVTSVDLSSEVGDSRSAAVRYLQPAVLHRRRIEQQTASRNGQLSRAEAQAALV